MKIAIIYVGEEVAYVNVHGKPKILPLTRSFFKNGRGALDQTTETLENLLR